MSESADSLRDALGKIAWAGISTSEASAGVTDLVAGLRAGASAADNVGPLSPVPADLTVPALEVDMVAPSGSLAANPCNMVLLEDGNFNYSWECSECLTRHRDTRKFEKFKTCPACGRAISSWVGFDD